MLGPRAWLVRMLRAPKNDGLEPPTAWLIRDLKRWDEGKYF